ncbi:hypothetical protein [Flavobacterium sp. LHD-85]|uniref:hypothetical protein n=1 Tax=Flavobacterium sp. LHD-85 TaxID=3071410 RepID=UPI0027DF586A|nr:hypothetical protein [Flavobacterium sp. LHD-85]MDQ6528253.1 hypothetical protein [Flavobacterium sp. LHD-85]
MKKIAEITLEFFVGFAFCFSFRGNEKLGGNKKHSKHYKTTNYHQNPPQQKDFFRTFTNPKNLPINSSLCLLQNKFPKFCFGYKFVFNHLTINKNGITTTGNSGTAESLLEQIFSRLEKMGS